MSKQAAYFLLLGMVYDLLPKKTFVNEMIIHDPKLDASRLKLVREGKTTDLKMLVTSVNVLKPEFIIPYEILELA